MKRTCLACLVAVAPLAPLAVWADIAAASPSVATASPLAATSPVGAPSIHADAHEGNDASRGSIEDQGAPGAPIAGDALAPVPRPIAPEPPSMLLAGVALGLLGWIRARRACR